jgi:hypothetical protein
MRRFLVLLMAACSSIRSQAFHTTVAPLENESFAGPCQYDITLPAGDHPVSAAWVLFDRGRDISKFYSDPDITAFARHHNLALVIAHQCPAKNAPGGSQEMDMDPAHGIGRALFMALIQFGSQTGHPELTSSVKLVLLGFPGTGALFAHFVGYAPDRVVASIVADPGHYDPVGIDRVHLTQSAIGVPELILTGGADRVSGTQRPYDYFRLYRDRGAPWAFVVQNKTPHCCIINAKPLILEWLEDIFKLRQPSPAKPLRSVDDSHGWLGFIRTCPSDVRDSWGTLTWDVCAASILKADNPHPLDQMPAGWFPTHRTALAWLAFIKQPQHPVASLP